MLGVAMYTTIETLFKRGLSKAEIARVTKHDWKTVSKVIKALEAGSYPVKKQHPSGLDGYKESIVEYLESGLSGLRIHELLQEAGCPLSYSSVKTYIRNFKGTSNTCIRFHTLPGEEAQVDFGYVGKLPDSQGRLRKAWVFNMRLSFSRLDFYKVVYDQTVETFITCHTEAFQYFGGLPKVVKIDNLKAAILEANFYQPIYQSLYKTYSEYYGFEIMPCRVRQPQEKGKVEAGIKYVKTNFFAGRTFATLTELESKLLHWLNYTCNARVHGTTRKIPRELFDEKEKQQLRALPLTPFRPVEVSHRKVYRDCHVYIDYNYYSVPFEYVGKVVDIELDENLVRIIYQGQQVALHQRLANHGEFSTNESHYPSYKLVCSSFSKKRLGDKMQTIGKHAYQLFTVLVEKYPTNWNRYVQGILSLEKRFNKHIINLACDRALSFGAIQYKQVKSICESGCYNLPISHQERVH
jgi:transposase